MKRLRFLLIVLLLITQVSAACTVFQGGSGEEGVPEGVPEGAPGVQNSQPGTAYPQPQDRPSTPVQTVAPQPPGGQEPTSQAAAAEPLATATLPLITVVPVTSCEPTQEDALGPYYTPGAPEREQVGEGYVLSGLVLSAEGCQPIQGARVEFWMTGPDGEYADAYRASQNTGESGEYRFESHFPPPYSGRPSHIHIRISAPGYQDLVTQHYPQAGETSAEFNLVLRPE